MKDKFGRWNFQPTLVSHAPPARVGRGLDGDPIYPVLRESGVEECCKYYENALRFLGGQSSEPPSLKSVISAAVPHGPIFKIRSPDDAAELDMFGPKASVWIKDEDRFAELLKRSPRYFDPEYVPVLLLLIAPGGSLRFNDSTPRTDKNGVPTPPDKRRFFVAFGRGHEQNIRLLRVITNAPKGRQVHRLTVKLDRNYHYDYRKNCLDFVRDESVIKSGRPAGYSDKGREAAIEAAGQHFQHATRRHGKTALRHIADSHASFKKLLRHCFEVADRLHAEQTRRRKLAG